MKRRYPGKIRRDSCRVEELEVGGSSPGVSSPSAPPGGLVDLSGVDPRQRHEGFREVVR